MSRAFIAEVIQTSTGVSKVQAGHAAADLLDAIIGELRHEGSFNLPGFGTFKVRDTAARKAHNPRTGEPIKVKAGRTVRFKASRMLKQTV